MQEQMIPPVGYSIVAYRQVCFTDYGYLDCFGNVVEFNGEVPMPNGDKIIVQKNTPRCRVFECISETPRKPQHGEFFEGKNGDLKKWVGDAGELRRKIYREVPQDEEI